MEEGGVRLATRQDFADVLPETLEEAEELAASIERNCTADARREGASRDRIDDLIASIERAVQRETHWGVADLVVAVGIQGVHLQGRCDTYYTKQLAQHAAMRIPGGERLINSIEVL